ncbi:AF4/FMR2 family member 1 isoform X2 [Xenopus laevis]|uniref:AF4/FMR2 family member 1 isoform X2 n=1 Tax=Xenopus laevis TaxID=8355 RepID=A0A8J0URD4_XENLA|nr:AF4/FMR2 family member 1 isoform X2 [Xenopus laevis]
MTRIAMAAQSSLYNEERNLLRLRERERRNQEVHQEKETFIDCAPLFPEPYKTSKGDELSSRIQSMLGNYEEVEEPIGANGNIHISDISKSGVAVSTLQKTERQRVGPPISSTAVSSRHHQRPQTDNDIPSWQLIKSHSSVRSHTQDLIPFEQRSRTKTKNKNGKRLKEYDCTEQSSSPSSISALSPLLSSLSSPIKPLSPLHSTQQTDSKPQTDETEDKAYRHATPVHNDTGNRDGPASVTNLITATQTFPSSMSSKASAMPQKPTAYVRPMDGQDQVLSESPYIKPLQEDYYEESYGNLTDEKLSKLENPSETFDTLSNEAQCVEEILKEMTHSWPPPLTAIHTPSTSEPSKFSFPSKENQRVPSVKGNQKQYDTSSKQLPSPQQGTSMLEDDLQLSDSDNSNEDEVCEKPSSSAPPSVLQSQTNSVVSAHSSSVESESSESDSSSDSGSEDISSDNEVIEPPRVPTPEPDPDIWQLRHYMNKVGQSAAPVENHNLVDQELSSQWESKTQGSIPPSPHESPKNLETSHKTSPWTSPEQVQNKEDCPESPVVSKTVTPRQTAGIKQPSKSFKSLGPEEPNVGLKVESEPYRPRDQPSKEKPSVKTKDKIELNVCKDTKASIAQTSEKKKHKSSHHVSSSKKCSNSLSEKSHSTHSLPQCSHNALSVTSVKVQSKANNRTHLSHPAVVVRENLHKDKVLLPIGDNRLPPLTNNHKTCSLVVKIELSLLSNVPGVAIKANQLKSKKESCKETTSLRKEESQKKHSKNHSKEHTKRKVEEGERNVTHKKIKLETETQSNSSHKQLPTKKALKESSESFSKKHRQEKPMSPTEHTQKKPEKLPQKRHPSENTTCSQLSTTTSKSNQKEPSSSKHRKLEEKLSHHVKTSKGSAENNTNPFPVPSLPNGNAKPTRPQLKFEEKLLSPEHYMKEAKKLKHKADAMSDKIGKSFNYLDAAMFFIECGIAMEADVQAPKSAYTMIAETVDLIKFILKLKNFTDSSAPAYEKSFAVLCMRCQSVLYMAMFRYKKDTAIKYSRTLGEHFKSSSRAAQVPSPCVTSTGTPSPLSPTPSPASSGGSQPGSIASNSGSSSVAIPQMIHHIASSYVNITSYFLYAYDIWEQADLLAKKHKEFFADLSTVVCPLALNSPMDKLVHYTRQGLQWLRLETSLT